MIKCGKNTKFITFAFFISMTSVLDMCSMDEFCFPAFLLPSWATKAIWYFFLNPTSEQFFPLCWIFESLKSNYLLLARSPVDCRIHILRALEFEHYHLCSVRLELKKMLRKISLFSMVSDRALITVQIVWAIWWDPASQFSKNKFKSLALASFFY